MSMAAHLSCLFIILREFDSENVSASVSWNLSCVCLHISCRCQVSFWILREFATRNSNEIIWIAKTFLWKFCSSSGIYIKLEIFRKKGWWSEPMCFRNYRLRKSWLDNSLKSVLSEKALTVIMWKCPKYFQNLHDSPFIMLFRHFEGSWLWKCLL